MKPLSASVQNFTSQVIGWGKVQKGTLEINPELANLRPYDMLERAGLAFQPLKVDIGYVNPVTGVQTPYDDKSIIIRSDTGAPLGVVGRRYVPVNYYTAIEAAFGDIVNMGGIPTRVVSLDNGRRMAIQFALPEGWIIGDCTHGLFANLFASHDGTIAIVINTADIRIVCGNTFQLAFISELDRHSAKHTTNVYNKLSAIQAALFGQRAEAEYYYGMLDAMAARPASSENVKSFLTALIPDKEKTEGRRENSQPANRREAVYLAAGKSAEERNSADITFYDLLQGVTRVTSYRQTAKDEAAGVTRDNFDYVNSGPGAELNTRAYSILSEMAEA